MSGAAETAAAPGPPPLVSVAMATFNGGRYLGEQLDTIYAQTWPRLEVVVSDDASSDATVGILAAYARSHGLRYAVNPARLGLVQNFARAISLCSGDLIALSDQDDLWKPQKIATLAGAIGGSTLIYGNVQEQVEGDSVRVETAFDPIFDFARRHGSGRPVRYLLAENWVVSHGLMFRRELVEHALPIPPHQPFHDGWLALVAAKLGGLRYLDERLQTYRRHAESLTFKRQPEERRGAPRGGALGSMLGRRRRFAAGWRRRCAAETARLADVLAHPLFDAADRAFVGELLAYYRSGLERGAAWPAFRSGLRVAPYFHTQTRRLDRLRVPLRGLAGGLLAARGGEEREVSCAS